MLKKIKKFLYRYTKKEQEFIINHEAVIERVRTEGNEQLLNILITHLEINKRTFRSSRTTLYALSFIGAGLAVTPIGMIMEGTIYEPIIASSSGLLNLIGILIMSKMLLSMPNDKFKFFAIASYGVVLFLAAMNSTSQWLEYLK